MAMCGLVMLKPGLRIVFYIILMLYYESIKILFYIKKMCVPLFRHHRADAFHGERHRAPAYTQGVDQIFGPSWESR